MKFKFVATCGGVALLAAGATLVVVPHLSTGPRASEAIPTGLTTTSSIDSSSGVRAVVSVDGYIAGSALELAGDSQLVISGSFEKIVGYGKASDFGVGSSSAATDPPVAVWRFVVSSTLKGEAAPEVFVVRFDSDSVMSDELAVEPGLGAVLFLSREVHGARVVGGTNQGLLVIAADGTLKQSDAALPQLSDATSLVSLTALLHS